jgi:hypothetical protein
MAVLFHPEPNTWGLRGDPYLWRAMRKRLGDQPMPGSADEVARLLHAAFEELTGADLASDPADHVYREEYAHGGMSSGMISLDTWRQELMPALVQRANTLLSV